VRERLVPRSSGPADAAHWAGAGAGAGERRPGLDGAHGTNPTDLVAQADAAMYPAKAERHRRQASSSGAIPIQRSARTPAG
jgi:hypothetical protein